MPEYRFGISLLSKDRFHDAYNEEVMIDKLTGEVLVKTPTGDTISYNYNSRLKSHIIETKAIANNVSIYGDIISIEMDDKYAPFMMEFDNNYIINETIFPYPKCKKILFNIDIDALDIDGHEITYKRNNILIEMSLSIYFDDGTRSDILPISCSIDQLNHKVFDVYDKSIIPNPEDKNIAGFILSNFTVKNIIVDYVSNEQNEHNKIIRPIFNSLFAVVQT